MYEQDKAYSPEADYPVEGGKLGVAPSQLPLSGQEKALSELHSTIEQLERRLSAVLRPSYPDNDRNMTEMAEKEGSPLNNQLTANNRAINKASVRIRELMERIEC